VLKIVRLVLTIIQLYYGVLFALEGSHGYGVVLFLVAIALNERWLKYRFRWLEKKIF